MRPIHQMDQTLGQREAQTRSLDFTGTVSRADERLEQARLVRFGDAHALIFDRDMQVFYPAFDKLSVTDSDPAIRAVVLDRIREQIEHHLADPQRVADHQGGAFARILDVNLPLPGQGFDDLAGLGDELIGGKRRRVQLYPPCIGAGQLENLVDQFEQVSARLADQADAVLLVRMLVQAQQIGKTQDRVERSL